MTTTRACPQKQVPDPRKEPGKRLVRRVFHRPQGWPRMLLKKLPQLPLRGREAHETALPPRVLVPQGARVLELRMRQN